MEHQKCHTTRSVKFATFQKNYFQAGQNPPPHKPAEWMQSRRRWRSSPTKRPVLRPGSPTLRTSRRPTSLRQRSSRSSWGTSRRRCRPWRAPSTCARRTCSTRRSSWRRWRRRLATLRGKSLPSGVVLQHPRSSSMSHLTFLYLIPSQSQVSSDPAAGEQREAGGATCQSHSRACRSLPQSRF